MTTEHTVLIEMKVGDYMRLNCWDVWRMPTGWVMAMERGEHMTSVFVPDVLNVEVKNHHS